MLELLDQVEDVISVEDFVSSESEPHSAKVQEEQPNEMPLVSDSIGNGVVKGPLHKVCGTSSDDYFLVLEVCFHTLFLFPF